MSSAASLSEQFFRLVARAQYPSRSLDHEWGAQAALVAGRVAGKRAGGACGGGGDAGADADVLHGAFCYPASYELGQSNNAIQILTASCGDLPGVVAERVFLPGADLRDLMRAESVPLLTLETNTPVRELDFLGITLPYELSFPAVLEVLDLAGLPLRASERDQSCPLVIGGGPSVYNPEPLAPFFDAFFLGEAEEALPQLMASLRAVLRPPGIARAEQLQRLAATSGLYVPSLYEEASGSGSAPSASGQGHGSRMAPRAGTGAPEVVRRAVARDFAQRPAVCSTVVPYSEVVHDRLAVEVQRGCSRGCRFCQAGMTYRPVRQRHPDDLLREILAGLKATGYDEVSLTSLSTTDYAQLPELLRRLKSRLAGTGVACSLPSLRIDTFSVEAARLVSTDAKKSGLTFAPEAGSQRLRDVINKNVSEEQLFDTVRAAAAGGWRRVKLYFMIGLPTETDADVVAIAELVARVQDMLSAEFDRSLARAFKIALSVASFVPKPHTPFQWEAQDSREELRRKQQLLKDALPRRGVALHYHGADTSFVEGVLARGDRRVADAIEAAWRAGAGTDAWEGSFNLARWEQAFADCGLDATEIACRARSFEEDLPWSHLSVGVSPAYLRREALAARAGTVTADCTFEACSVCGACQAARIDPQTVAGLRLREGAGAGAEAAGAEAAGAAAAATSRAGGGA
ncbi:MAG: TIGR03960 family B12-binding radical SAM protein [Coriobacteriia bacterium]|nr:TIGR03960 family B12-binding radical SAM protein [Coriobacteriia bacterium]